MASAGTCAVTGAFGYSGRYISRRLLDSGCAVRTLTNSPRRDHDFGDAIDVYPLAFEDRPSLVRALDGCTTLINTYWVRFNHRNFKHSEAVTNTLELFAAAREAGVERVVHVSITNPSEDSPFEYFHGKAVLEAALVESGLSHAILRPTVLFGGPDILVNNIAWALRRFPVFGVFGDGRYGIQPMHVDDFAALAVAESRETRNTVVDAIGPETFTFRELVETIGEIIGKRRRIVSVPPRIGHWFAWVVGRIVGDVMLTKEEIGGLMAGLLLTDSPTAGPTRLTDWAREHADGLGRRYASELARRKNRQAAYETL